MNPPVPPSSAGSPDQSPDSSYGYGAYSQPPDGPQQRNFQDYVLILRERIWYILVVFLVIFSSVLVYTLTQTKIYQSRSLIQILRRDPAVLKVQSVTDNDVRSLEDLNTIVQILESATIIQKVSDRLTGEKLAQFMAPYLKGGSGDPLTPAEVLFRNRRIIPRRMSLVIEVQYRHPDRVLAADITNMFVDEFIAYNSRVRIGESMKAVDELRARVNDQRKKVEDLATRLQTYRETHKMVSLDQRRDIVTETLKARNILVTQTNAKFKDAEVRWKQIQEFRAAGRDLTELSFIAVQPIIGELKKQQADQKILVAQLSERYRAKHPRMLDATRTLAQIDAELAKATAEAASIVEGDYQSALRNAEEARSGLVEQESQSLGVDRVGVRYEDLDRELKIEELVLENLMGRMRETTMSSTLDTQNARVIDTAYPSQPEQYVKPVILLNLGLGLIGGLGLGLAVAIFVAFIDDRVKSSFDIEGLMGLHLLGIVPQVRKMAAHEKAQVVSNHADRQVSEAFLTLHSSLRLKDTSKAAKCILVTSTIPGEGKSFTTTNLALTFASHGEKVVVIDCDLRRPNIHKSFRIPNQRGVIDLCGGETRVEDVVVTGPHPNLDIIPAGGRAKNPTHVLNSVGFEQMIADLRARYDRVFIDTPPIAAVSDALIILPLVDGSIFTVFFNKVRRRAAQYAARRLLDSHVPNFGAVLNGLNMNVSGYYYGQYYDKSYKDYYVVMSKKDDTNSPLK
ncbi:MAG: polysaccharide biosynthesis tyrosine autokinase [Nibricoccus sp.]